MQLSPRWVRGRQRSATRQLGDWRLCAGAAAAPGKQDVTMTSPRCRPRRERHAGSGRSRRAFTGRLQPGRGHRPTAALKLKSSHLRPPWGLPGGAAPAGSQGPFVPAGAGGRAAGRAPGRSAGPGTRGAQTPLPRRRAQAAPLRPRSEQDAPAPAPRTAPGRPRGGRGGGPPAGRRCARRPAASLCGAAWETESLTQPEQPPSRRPAGGRVSPQRRGPRMRRGRKSRPAASGAAHAPWVVRK